MADPAGVFAFAAILFAVLALTVSLLWRRRVVNALVVDDAHEEIGRAA